MELQNLIKEVADIRESMRSGDQQYTENLAELEKQLGEFGELANRVKTLEGNIDAVSERVVREVKRYNTVGERAPLPGNAFGCEERAADFGRWMRNVAAASKGLALPYGEKALTPILDTGGGALIPDTFVPEIVRIVADVNQLIAIARKVPLGPGRTRIPKRTTGVTAYWVASGGTITPSTPGTAQIVMEPEKLAALVAVDNEMDDESAVDVGQFLGFELGYALGKEFERVMCAGTGSPADGGITGLTLSGNLTDCTMGSGDTGFANLAWEDVVDAEVAIVNAARNNARYVLSTSCLGYIKKLKDSAGLPIWQQPAGSEPSLINGYPYTVVDQLPKAADSGVSKRFIWFGDFSAGLFAGVRRNLRVDRSSDAYFTTDQTGFRALMTADATVVAGSVSGENPISAIKTAAA